MLEKDGHFFSQSQSIIRMLGRDYGYYPDNATLGWRIDSIIDANADLTSASYKYLLEQDPEKKKAATENFVTNVFPTFCAAIEKRIASNSNHHHAVEDTLTTADFVLAAQFYSIVYNEASPAHKELQAELDKHAVLKEYIHHLGDHHFKEYFAHRPTPRPF